MAEQYDVSPTEKKELLDRMKRRTALREEFLRLSTNPHRHSLSEGGVVFDSSLQRYDALKATSREYFKPTFKTVRFGLLGVVIPMFVFGYAIKRDRDYKECLYRTGQVAYKDRRFKFI
ncbi:NADH dehydrogenase [ubiquinone] 1 beta subcomplex subunit 4 [Photinus pyralis]|uniref:NADH dehydrogenase [ubiquinone] 1 beta subcomplex subunit 4 n=1 Tax=Photinus pyralis TaxID=7054 RepID=UPI0012671A12|nr:NADH dehydrogenase [ubiquinone] 1 beta subcomplex subunit 4 [Photinus pyralis]